MGGGVTIPVMPVTAYQPAQPQQPDYIRLAALLGQQKLQQAQTQGLQQENQVRQLQMQQMQRQQQDQQTIQQAVAQNPGKTYSDILPQLQGRISPSTWTSLAEADQKITKGYSDQTKEELENSQARHAQYQQLYNGVMQLPDDQIAQNWPQIAQQIDSVPGNKIQLDPSKPMTKQQLQQFGPFLSLNDAYLQNELAKREQTAKIGATEADTALKNMQARQGGTTDVANYISNYLQAKGLPDTPQNRLTAHQAYTQETKIQPAQVRVEGYAQTREYPVLDTKNNNTLQYVSAADLNAANRSTPGRFVPAGEGNKALGKTALIEDIRGNLQQVRQSLSNPQMPEFTASQRASIALALGGPDPSTALSAAFRGGVLGSLGPEQQDYLINMAQLKENAMAMRSVLGAGQGSEDMRRAITATLPGSNTPNKAYALNQLQKFENVLNRLEQGVPSVPLRNVISPQGGGPQSGYVRIQASDGSLHDLPSANLDRARQRDPGLKVVQ